MMKKKLQTLPEFNDHRRKLYSQDGPYLNGIECPICFYELYDINDGTVMCSSPPQVSITCFQCKWSGTRIA